MLVAFYLRGRIRRSRIGGSANGGIGPIGIGESGREALVALERFVKATDPPGPASVRMYYDYDKRASNLH